LTAIHDAQSRSRGAFFITLVATAAILIAIFNTYWAFERNPASKFTGAEEKEVADHQVRNWVDSTYVGNSLLGIRIGSGDIAVVGSLALYLFAWYHFFCVRRENHEIGSLLRDTHKSDKQTRYVVHYGIRSFMVFNPVSRNDAAIDDLYKPNARESLFFARSAFQLLIWLPFATILFVIVSDGAWAASFTSEGRSRMFSALPFYLQLEFLVQTSLAIAAACGIFGCCTRITRFYAATRRVLDQYDDGLGVHMPGSGKGLSDTQL